MFCFMLAWTELYQFIEMTWSFSFLVISTCKCQRVIGVTWLDVDNKQYSLCRVYHKWEARSIKQFILKAYHLDYKQRLFHPIKICFVEHVWVIIWKYPKHVNGFAGFSEAVIPLAYKSTLNKIRQTTNTVKMKHLLMCYVK